MARLPPVSLAFILLYIVNSDFGECVHVILGDPATFPATGNCLRDEPVAGLYRVGEHSTRLVAARERGVCKPAEDYKDRVDQNSCFAFSRSVYTDAGLYEFICGSRKENIQLDVVVGFEASVTEGEPVKLQCSYITAGKHVESIRWERNGKVVLERNLSTGETKYGTGFERRVSLSPDGYTHGDWSLIWDQALLEDQGDYFCSFHNKGVREEWGDPAAVRLKVTEKKPDQTTLRPPLTPTQSATEEKEMGTWIIVGTTAAVMFLTVAPLFFLLGWCLKSRRSRVSSGSSCGRYSDVGLGPLNSEHPQANGGPSSHAESGV